MSATATKKKPSEAVRLGRCNYSREMPGDDGNYHWSAKADVTAGGYVGISQTDENGAKDRVLLSAQQWKEIVRFVREETPR